MNNVTDIRVTACCANKKPQLLEFLQTMVERKQITDLVDSPGTYIVAFKPLIGIKALKVVLDGQRIKGRGFRFEYLFRTRVTRENFDTISTLLKKRHIHPEDEQDFELTLGKTTNLFVVQHYKSDVEFTLRLAGIKVESGHA